MKYTTEELFNMTDDEIIDICGNKCETSKCPFKPSLRKYREDGFCVVTTYEMIDKWISEDESKIEYLKDDIKELEEGIQRYKKWKKVFEKELENERTND